MPATKGEAQPHPDPPGRGAASPWGRDASKKYLPSTPSLPYTQYYDKYFIACGPSKASHRGNR